MGVPSFLSWYLIGSSPLSISFIIMSPKEGILSAHHMITRLTHLSGVVLLTAAFSRSLISSRCLRSLIT